MPGLFDLLDGDDARLGLALLAASGPTMQPTNIGQRIAGAVQSVAGQRDNDLRRQLIRSQIGENDNQNLYRSAQVDALQRKVGLLSLLANRINGGGSTAAASPAGLLGTVAAPAGLSSAVGGGGSTPAPSGAGGFPLSPTDLALAKIAGLPDLADIYKLTEPNWVNVNGNLVNTKAPGFTGGIQDGIAVSNDGRATMWKRNPDGSVVMGAPGGALDTYKAYQDVGNRSQASYTPGRPTIMPGGRMGGQSQLQEIGGAPPPSAFGGLPPAQAGVSGSFIGDPQAVSAAIANIRDPQERANALAAFEQQMRAPGATRETPGGGLEFSPQEKGEQDARRAGLIKQAESDVTPTADKLARYDNAQQAIGLIDRALQHPGIGTATGMSGTMDPRNYLPGTDAKNFQVLLDQIRGGAFMSAYQSLRGGGAITEKEGEKAQAAIARIDRAQSTEEFERGLRDYRDVLQRGYERARQQLGAVPEATEPRRLPNRTSAAPSDQPPVARLKTAPSDADIRNTALKYGMTVEQVKQRLGMR